MTDEQNPTTEAGQEPETITQAAEAVIPAVEQAAEAVAAVPIVAVEEAKVEMSAWENTMEIWFQDLRLNLIGMETEFHNKLFTAKEDLKQRLRGLIA